MAYLVLSGIGALICASIKKIMPHDFSAHDETISSSPRELRSLSEMISSRTPAVQEVVRNERSENIDWKRFWELFSTKRELTEAERAEMARLKEALRDFHQRALQEEKKKADEFRRAVQSKLTELHISENRSDFFIHREDYKRGSDKERDYIRLHRNYLFRIYDNRCAKCGNDSNGLEIDHFFFSKNEGGCFEMHHREGYRVNNAIPLCESCNRSKSDRSYRSFFSSYELLRVLKFNAKMNERLNENKVYKWIRRSCDGDST